MDTESFVDRLHALNRPSGATARDLRVGPWVLRFDGLDGASADELEIRWGPFLVDPAGEPTTTIRVFDAGERPWLGEPRYRGERYRLERLEGPGAPRLVSHNFAVDTVDDPGHEWRVGLTSGAREPTGRILENVARIRLAGLALNDGGFAMHGAGVEHDGRAFIYCGPSRSGKTTAVVASAPARNLGDDFSVVFRCDGAWRTPAVPFDGAERVGASAARGTYPVAAIWRLYQDRSAVVERPPRPVASASLLSCAAFPWVYAERSSELLEHVERIVADGIFAHLRFALDSDLFEQVILPAGAP